MAKKQTVIIPAGAAAEELAATFMGFVQQRAKLVAGRRIAHITTGAAETTVTDDEALQALQSYRDIADINLRNRAARGAVMALMAEFADSYFPLALADDVVHAFRGLDVGTTRGIAIRDETGGRREGAPDYDDLARFIAAEVAHAQGLHGLKSDRKAIAMTTGVAHPDNTGTVPSDFRTADCTGAGASFKQIWTLFTRGRELIGPDGMNNAREAGARLAAGEADASDFHDYRARWLRRFADGAIVREILALAQRKHPKGDKRQKRIEREKD